MERDDADIENSVEYAAVPPSAVRLFRLAWQLETWLRSFVYVELRASRSDWEEPIKKKVKSWPPNSLPKDKSLHHMSTPHQAALSYVTFGELWDIISDSANWPLFETYFPPKKHTDVRIEEVKAIRNRVAHFRKPHENDEARFQLFLRDMEQGVRRFCDRYMEGKWIKDDQVMATLTEWWPTVGYGIEVMLPSGGNWLYAQPPATLRPKMHAKLEIPESR